MAESTSIKVEQFMTGIPVGELAVSEWTRVEFASLLAREVRMRALNSTAARKADAQFESVLAKSFVVWTPAAGDFGLAKEYLGNYGSGLRAGDALHLAIAKNHNADAVYTLDKSLLKAGKTLGLRISAGFGLPSHRG